MHSKKYYQYKYLLEKLSCRDYRNDLFLCERNDNRISFYYEWLYRINNKKNYGWHNLATIMW